VNAEKVRELEESKAREVARAQDDRRLEQLRLQLTQAFQQEFAAQQAESSRLGSEAAAGAAEVKQLRERLAERDEQIRFLTSRHQVMQPA
jgi:hypothetical protein